MFCFVFNLLGLDCLQLKILYMLKRHILGWNNMLPFNICLFPLYFPSSIVQFSSAQSLSHVRLFATHESQHARPPCLSPYPRVHSDSCPSSPWCHSTISSLVVPFSFCPQSLPASESFPMSQLFAWGGQSTGVSALASFPPKKSRVDRLQNGLVGSPCSPRDSQESSPTPQFKSINSSALSLLHSPTLAYVYKLYIVMCVYIYISCAYIMQYMCAVLSRSVVFNSWRPHGL